MAIKLEGEWMDYTPETTAANPTANKVLSPYEVAQCIPIANNGLLGETKTQLTKRGVEGIYVESAGIHGFVGTEELERYETRGPVITLYWQYHPEDSGIPYTFRVDKSDISFIYSCDAIENPPKDAAQRAA